MAYLQEGLKLISILVDEGYSSFIVGGAVRDILLGLDINDIDIATSATPEKLKEMFITKEAQNKYNSIKVMFNDYEFEVTTFRKDLVYLDNRHPKFEVANTLESDIVRRDFTVNALAFDKDEKLIDLVGGKADLDNKIIRAIGNPNIRFEEDSLRILRAVYYASRLHFKIEEATYKALKEEGKLVQNLSFDRVYQMLYKMVNEKVYKEAFKLLVETYIYSYLKPFSEAIYEVYANNIDNLDWRIFLALAFNKKDLKMYSFKDKSMLDTIYYLKQNNLLDPTLIYKYQLEDLVIAYNLKKREEKLNYSLNDLIKTYNNLPIRNIKDLDISNLEIIDLTGLQGEELGSLIKDLFTQVLKGKLTNEYTILRKYCIKYRKLLKNNSK